MNLPNEITIQPNDVNGAPYLGYEGGEGVVYVRGDQWSTDMDAAPYETPVFTCWMGNEKRKPIVLVNIKNSGGHLGKKDNWWHSRQNQQPTHWRHIDLPQTKETK